jgi:hypothetical protein
MLKKDTTRGKRDIDFFYFLKKIMKKEIEK